MNINTSNTINTSKTEWAQIENNILSTISNTSYYHVFARTETETIGLGQFHIARGHLAYERILNISSSYVLPAYKEIGIGKALLGKMIFWVDKEKCDEAELNVLANNGVLDLYKSFGFTELENSLKNYYLKITIL